jgi:hypothetical protein
MRELATLCRDRLDPRRKCLVELSNELWNFRQGPELAQRMIDPNWSWQTHGKLYYGAVAPRVLRMSAIFKQVWGAKAQGRLEIVLAGQSGNPWHVEQALTYYEDNNMRPSDAIDAVAIAPYFRPMEKKDYTDFGEMMNDTLASVTARLEKIRSHKAMADKHGLRLYAYEGGQHIWFNVTKNDSFQAQAQGDPRMAEAYRRYVRMWQEEVGDLFMHYTFTGGSWGLLKDLNQPGSVKWDAVMSELLPPGDATLDGKVGYEDFEVLRRHFGQADRWWEQGDFSGDHKVDAADLQILAANAKGLTALQQAEVDAFMRQRAGQ